MGHLFVCDKCGTADEKLRLHLFACTSGDLTGITKQFDLCAGCAKDYTELSERWIEEGE